MIVVIMPITMAKILHIYKDTLQCEMVLSTQKLNVRVVKESLDMA